MQLADLTAALGYRQSRLYREDDGDGLVAQSDQHLIRTARAAGVKGTYFFRTSPETGGYRPAVHVAEAADADEARQIHKRLWNQGTNPFLIVLLPVEVRVYTGFAYDPTKPGTGRVFDKLLDSRSPDEITRRLASFSADSINRGDLWQQQRKHLKPDQRVDTTLLAHLKALSEVLQRKHGLKRQYSHSLIGRFVYLHFLRARKILSDEWIAREAGVEPESVFTANATKAAFRRLAKAVEATFNGKIFPIAWGSPHAPDAAAVNMVARVFAGEDLPSGQLHLPFTAYDFSYIPIELLSSIYEQFLHAEGPDASQEDGAHYTPEPLADYLVSEVNSIRPLEAGMRILDPCCGSGVFLVVAFRRLVELECRRQGRQSLAPQELKNLLQRNFFAVERNETACQITAFSLILTMLSYVDPPELDRLKKSFKFPSLVGRNVFPEDFFAPDGRFWRLKDPETQGPLCFDWIIGNPPWLELDSSDPKAKPLLDWANTKRREYHLARARTGEAFAWRVREKLADKGVAGLVLAAKTLTNDHLKPWRAKFFAEHEVHRITNLANLAYVIFPKVKEPAMTLVFSRLGSGRHNRAILHVGPFVANQLAVRRSRKAWVVGLTESEIKSIPVSEAVKGDASTWKLALWGNHRDPRELARLKALFPTTLAQVAAQRGWHLALGLQLRGTPGKKVKNAKGEWKDENEYVGELEGLPLLDHKALVAGGPCLDFTGRWQVKNTHGCHVRGGRKKGVGLVRGPHLFLWNDFAAFGRDDCIVEHSKLALAGPPKDEDWLHAVSLLWTCSLTQYLLVFELSSDWGVGRSLIDLGDAEGVRLPILDARSVSRLAELHHAFARQLAEERAFDASFRRELDHEIATALKLPAALMRTATDFAVDRLALNQGKVPSAAATPPDSAELRRYAARLTAELDEFIGGKAHHQVTVRHAPTGVAASIEITNQRTPITPIVLEAVGPDASILKQILEAAEQQFSQWVYVKRSVRLFADNAIHLIKPTRKMEWTEARAALDADDLIAEIVAKKEAAK